MWTDEEHVDEQFEGVTLAEQRVVDSRFEGCRFVRCTFEGTHFVDCQFSDCLFEDCTMVGVRFADSLMTGVRMMRGRAMGCDFSGVRSLVFDAHFEGVRMDMSNLSGLPMRGFRFVNCELREAVFSEADLRQASFVGCDLTGAVIRHAKLQNTDFRDSRGCQIDVKTCTIHQTKVDASTAVGVLRDLGLVCHDLDAMFR